MVFSSMPAYLDPANWQQQPSPHHHHHHLFSGNNNNNNSQLHSLPPPPPPIPSSNTGNGGVEPGGAGSIRPNSMADRARMANIPLPEPALKCPRCDSTNTKFCYFNNYSLTQPRHFCKTCRRYWTRGGALRNVPVGGGCRRNKRSSSSKGGGSSRSKSPDVSSSDRPAGSINSSVGQQVIIPSSSAGNTVDMLGLSPHQIPPLRFLNHPFGGGNDSLGMSYDYGGGELGFSIGGGSTLFEQQWRFQHQTAPSFPFLNGALEASNNGLFEGGGGGGDQFQGYYSHLRPRMLSSAGGGSSSTSSVAALASSQMGSNSMIKTEDPNHQNHHQVLRNQDHQVQPYWVNAGGNGNGGSINAWSDLSGFSSTSAATNHPLQNF